jgi:hypothetical protein
MSRWEVMSRLEWASAGAGEEMDRKAKLVVAGLAASGLLGLGAAGVRAAADNGDDDHPLRGRNHDRATSAALDHVGGGTVTKTETGDAGEAETEPGDDGEAYEVDIRRDDGSQVEAELDSNFNVTGTEADDVDEGADAEEDGDQDEGTGDYEGSDDD